MNPQQEFYLRPSFWDLIVILSDCKIKLKHKLLNSERSKLSMKKLSNLSEWDSELERKILMRIFSTQFNRKTCTYYLLNFHENFTKAWKIERTVVYTLNVFVLLRMLIGTSFHSFIYSHFSHIWKLYFPSSLIPFFALFLLASLLWWLSVSLFFLVVHILALGSQFFTWIFTSDDNDTTSEKWVFMRLKTDSFKMIWTTAFDMKMLDYMAIVFCHAHHLRFEGYLWNFPLNVYMLSMNLSLSLVRVCVLYKYNIILKA
jgi:hypothetical protein